MKNERNKSAIHLLPIYFKLIGCVVCVVAIAITILERNSGDFHSILNTAIRFDLFIAGLLLICFSKDKVEDESKQHMRLQAMASTFIWAVIYVMLRPFGNMLFGLSDFSSRDLITLMIIWYLMTYYFLKSTRY